MIEQELDKRFRRVVFRHRRGHENRPTVHIASTSICPRPEKQADDAGVSPGNRRHEWGVAPRVAFVRVRTLREEVLDDVRGAVIDGLK
jgi:hypothetical protein